MVSITTRHAEWCNTNHTPGHTPCKTIRFHEETQMPVHVSTALTEWLQLQELSYARLQAFHDYPDNPALLTAYVDTAEQTEAVRETLEPFLSGFNWDAL